MISDDGIIELLDGELEDLSSRFPDLRFRICREMGRRLSHLAGDTAGLSIDELRLDLGAGLILLVGGRWRESLDDLNSCAREIRVKLEKLS